MSWQIKLGRIFGVDTYVHLTFFLLLIFLAVAEWLRTGSWEEVVARMVLTILLFACVLAHEFGHVLAARQVGVKTRDVTLLPLGGIARLERIPAEASKELWIAVAGPLVNVAIAGLLGLGLWAAGQPLFVPLDLGSGTLVHWLLTANLVLVLFNMIPAFPMDGGRVFRAALASAMDYVVATNIAASVGKTFALLFGFLGLFSNPLLVLIAVFIWVGASAEAESAGVRNLIGQIRVERVMVTQFETVDEGERLGEVIQRILRTHQEDFPVMSEGALVGILFRSNLLEGLSKQGVDARVSDVMTRDYATVTPEEEVARLIDGRDASSWKAIPVMARGQLVGMFTAHNLTEFVLIKSALRSAPLSPA